MGILYRSGMLALVCLALAGCAGEQKPAVSRSDAIAMVQTGAPVLRCRQPCLSAWQHAQPEAGSLAAGARWADLAALVIGTGYQDDLSLYYLGQAAEGIGSPAAARSYYRQSTQLSGTTISCRNLSRMCGGIDLPKAALLREAAIARELAHRRYRRGRPARPAPASAEEPPITGEALAPSAPEGVAPPPAPPPLPPPPPAPARGGRPASEYIEPPPAAH